MNINTGRVIPIFPTPIMVNNINRNFTVEEIKCILNYKNNVFKNTDNITSNDLYVLDNPILINLKKICEDALHDYLINIYNPINPDDIELKITQSWLNFTSKNQSHHFHHHPNSVVSGSLYINANKDIDNIVFGKSLNLNLQIQAKEQNHFNSVEMHFPVNTGDIVLFPSNLEHGVPATIGNYDRISLAFNSFFSGNIGYIDGPLKGFNFLKITSIDNNDLNLKNIKRYQDN